MKWRLIRATCALALVAVLGAGCAVPENDGMTRMKPDAMAFAQAKATCWERAWGGAMGGPGETASRERAYAACMAQMGWQDMRQPF